MCKIECKFEVLLDVFVCPEGWRALAQASSSATATAPRASDRPIGRFFLLL
ncbi:hypothetical protein [Microcoleus sp. CAWBG58]|uniref:hypothetical protein n=1 Tax=Microcoleus sp. CAWBG58 TaxID=2841651 RepID=UPI0025EEE6E2|nr:hypothetical protein [Microcoleus sp. CAWBG58]